MDTPHAVFRVGAAEEVEGSHVRTVGWVVHTFYSPLSHPGSYQHQLMEQPPLTTGQLLQSLHLLPESSSILTQYSMLMVYPSGTKST